MSDAKKLEDSPEYSRKGGGRSKAEKVGWLLLCFEADRLFVRNNGRIPVLNHHTYHGSTGDGGTKLLASNALIMISLIIPEPTAENDVQRPELPARHGNYFHYPGARAQYCRFRSGNLAV